MSRRWTATTKTKANTNTYLHDRTLILALIPVGFRIYEYTLPILYPDETLICTGSRVPGFEGSLSLGQMMYFLSAHGRVGVATLSRNATLVPGQPLTTQGFRPTTFPILSAKTRAALLWSGWRPLSMEHYSRTSERVFIWYSRRNQLPPFIFFAKLLPKSTPLARSCSTKLNSGYVDTIFLLIIYANQNW